MTKKYLKSICCAFLTVALVLSAVFMNAVPAKAEDGAIDWSQWDQCSTEYMTQVVAEAHSAWGSGGLANWPTFDINTDDPVFGILKKGGEFEPLTEGVDYTIERIARTINHITTECETFDKSLPGDYGFTLVGMGKYTGRVSVKFSLSDTNPFSFDYIELTNNCDEDGQLKLGEEPKFYFNGKELVEGTDYKVIGLKRDGGQLTDFTDFGKVGLYTLTIEGMGTYSGSASLIFYVYEAPETEAPETEAPETEAPETEAPETEAPETEAPETEAPETEAPETEAPETEAPETEAPETEAPETEAPETEAPETEAPETEVPETETEVDDAIDWSEWDKYSFDVYPMRVAEQHAKWTKGGLTMVPDFECNTAEPVFGIIYREGGVFEPLTAGVDYEIVNITRVEDFVEYEYETFDISIPGRYYVTLAGKGKYRGEAEVQFVLWSPNGFDRFGVEVNSDSKDRIKLGTGPVLTFKGENLVEGKDYTIENLWVDGTEITDSPDFSKVGEYSMTVKGMGIYSGKFNIYFCIYKPVGKATLSATKFTYTGKNVAPTLTIKDAKGNKIASTQYTVKNLKAKTVGKHTVTITFKNDYRFNDNMTVAYTINPKNATVKSVVKLSKGFKVTWVKSTSANASGYQIRYSTKSSMASAKSVKVKGYSSTSKSITGLKAKKKYYVQVRTYKTVGGKTYYSAWSAKKAITTK